MNLEDIISSQAEEQIRLIRLNTPDLPSATLCNNFAPF